MKRILAVCWLFAPLLAAAMPRLELQLRLDPATRAFEAEASLADTREIAGFGLGKPFEILALTADGKPIEAKETQRDGRRWIALPAGSRRVTLRYRAVLPALAPLDARQVLTDRTPVTGPEGTFLPAAADWYPAPRDYFGYRVTLALPPGQKGLVPGDPVDEHDGPQGYRATYDFPHPAEGIDLMAGPYVVAERVLKLPGGRPVRVRTWFHAELAPLAEGYLNDSARYLERYGKLIGDYPFGSFSVVSSPTPTGFGMPSLTYLGREVLRLPFIRASSLGHEVLHNWWGNGVYPDWAHGNWSEGLTTFLADYAYKEDVEMGGGEEAARAMRLGWLRDLAAVPPGSDGALADFTARHHGISSIVGYDKSAMVFLMLRDEIGADAFARGLRRLWAGKRFREASWADLEAAFAAAAGRPLKDFFRQWVARPGAPTLSLRSATRKDGMLTVRIEQAGDYALAVPLRLVFADRTETRIVRLRGPAAALTLDRAAGAQAIELDPDYRLWRRVDPALLPAILREVFVAPRAALIVPDGDAALRNAAQTLAGRVLDARPATAENGTAAMPGVPTLVVGSDVAVDTWLARHALPPRPDALKRAPAGTAQVWAGRDARGTPYAIVAARDAAAVESLARPLPHYGSQSWLAFDGAKTLAKGLLPPRVESVPVK